MSAAKWHPWRMWRLTIKEPHAYADIEISHDLGLFGVTVRTYDKTHTKLREEWGSFDSLRKAKCFAEAGAVELLKHAAQAMGVAS